MATDIYLITIAIFFGTILVVFAMKYISTAYAARARLANDDVQRALLDRTATALASTQASLTSIETRLAALSTSMASVEKILRQVG